MVTKKSPEGSTEEDLVFGREVLERLAEPNTKVVALISALRANPKTRHFLERSALDSPDGTDLESPPRTERSGTRRPAQKGVKVEPKPEEDTLTLVVAYANGTTQEEIAKEHHLHIQTVRKRLHDAGVITRHHATILSDEDLKLAKALLDQGKSARTVAKQLGVAHTTLLRNLKRHSQQQ